ncbi:hypothetical protein MJ585_06030 [Klebsiella pneumoniae]|nr:hypothetical protein MJ585_06030 [Klebsiella pneumoniae]
MRRALPRLRHLTVGDFRDWLLDDATDTATLQRVARAITRRWRRRSVS